jgi:antitoxin component YwqK of YwqJK toxin-antitoxin module
MSYYQSEEFFKLVTDKVGRGKVDDQGRRVGMWKGYIDGNVEWEVEYFEGVMEGKARIIRGWRSWTIEGFFSMGKMTGMWTYWDKESVGRVSHIQFYLSDVKHGMFASYYPRGNCIEEMGMYNMGKRVGEWVRYTTGGEVCERGIYDKDGKLTEAHVYRKGEIIEGTTGFEYDEINNIECL